jgi:DNA-binding HxlR family transcriptional regulator
MNREKRRSACPVACTLDILGDRWTMIVVRDLFRGARKYGDFLASPERITTNILAERLKRLETEGLIEKMEYQDNPVRYVYSLTQMGKDLSPLVREMTRWAFKYKKQVILKRTESSPSSGAG